MSAKQQPPQRPAAMQFMDPIPEVDSVYARPALQRAVLALRDVEKAAVWAPVSAVEAEQWRALSQDVGSVARVHSAVLFLQTHALLLSGGNGVMMPFLTLATFVERVSETLGMERAGFQWGDQTAQAFEQVFWPDFACALHRIEVQGGHAWRAISTLRGWNLEWFCKAATRLLGAEKAPVALKVPLLNVLALWPLPDLSCRDLLRALLVTMRWASEEEIRLHVLTPENVRFRVWVLYQWAVTLWEDEDCTAFMEKVLNGLVGGLTASQYEKGYGMPYFPLVSKACLRRSELMAVVLTCALRTMRRMIYTRTLTLQPVHVLGMLQTHLMHMFCTAWDTTRENAPEAALMPSLSPWQRSTLTLAVLTVAESLCTPSHLHACGTQWLQLLRYVGYYLHPVDEPHAQRVLKRMLPDRYVIGIASGILPGVAPPQKEADWIITAANRSEVSPHQVRCEAWRFDVSDAHPLQTRLAWLHGCGSC